MNNTNFNGLLIVSVIAVAAPIITAGIRRARVPNAVVEIVAGVVAVIGLTLGRAGRNERLEAFLTTLQDTTAEIRVRIAVALLIGFVAWPRRWDYRPCSALSWLG